MKKADITPTEEYKELAQALNCKGTIFFKREDFHPYGSHKGRSIPVMIDDHVKDGKKHFAISSSGNAALAAAMYVRELNEKGAGIELDIYIGQHANPHKAELLKEVSNDVIRVMTKERPKQAVIMAEQEGVVSLRQSTDDLALMGYESLARELSAAKKVGAVFVGTSSGTTAQALAQYFVDNKLPIQVHIVQTSACHPISDAFGTYDGPEEESDADAIVDKVAHRKETVTSLVKKTGGRGWTITNDDISYAQDVVTKHTGQDISTNSALSVAGLIQAIELGYEFNGNVVCLICGE